MYRTVLILALILNLLSIPLSSAFANGVSVREVSGNSIIPVQQNNIRMVNEAVRVKNERVTATFTFQNLSKKPVVIMMGFPFRTDDDPLDPASFEYLSSKDAKALRFSVKVDNIDSPVSRKSVSDTYNQNTGDKYDFMYTWPVSFQPNEKHVVECSYRVQWADELGLNGSFTYIAKTGARWQGNLDFADFFIELDEGTYRDFKSGEYNFKITPEGYKVNGNTIEWHYTNWKPKHDFTITYDRIPHDEDAAIVESVIGRFDFKKTYDGDKRYYTIADIESHRTDLNGFFAKFYVKVLRNEIFARHGRVFKSENLQRAFAGRDWYKPDPSFSEKMLNKYEKANVDLIYGYEKKKGWQ